MEMVMQGTQRPRTVEASGEKQGRDYISEMPPEILAIIVSRLNFKEAGRTSVLSTRWKNIWKFFFGLVTLDSSVKLFKIQRRKKMPPLIKCNRFVSEWGKFMSNAEKVLTSLENPSLEGIKVCIDMGNPAELCRLIEFARAKKVQVLDLDFSYHFTEPFLSISKSIRNELPNSFASETLRELRLIGVDVTGKVLEQFIARCPSLETLYVKGSKTLSRLRVSRSRLKLKRLELLECKIRHLFLDAKNLVAFNYSGEPGVFIFHYVPKLVEASFGGLYSTFVQSRMTEIGVYKLLSRLIVLKLEVNAFSVIPLQVIPIFKKVKHLELTIHQEYVPQMDHPVFILGAFPLISLLKLKFIREVIHPPAEEPWTANVDTPYKNLEVIEISGCRNDHNQNELIESVIRKAPNLKKIVLDPLSAIYEDRSEEFKDMMKSSHRDFNLWFADRIKSQFAPNVEMVVM